LKSEITVKDCAVEQHNFNDYKVARMSDTPYETIVHIIDSEEKRTGVGSHRFLPLYPLCAMLFMPLLEKVSVSCRLN